MDIGILGIGLAIFIVFVIGLLLDVDTFAGGVFSMLKKYKKKDKNKDV